MDLRSCIDNCYLCSMDGPTSTKNIKREATVMDKLGYKGHYPSAARWLIEEDICSTPRQRTRDLRWAEGVDIIYTLRNLGPANFRKYSDSLLLLAYQEAMRYKDVGRWKFAVFDVRLGRLKKGRDLPETISFQAHMHDDVNIMVYGPEYSVPTPVFLTDQVEKIIDIVRRYADQVNKQAPFKVIRLTISIREPRRSSGTVRNP